jgi:hypothetical protein
LGITWTRAHPPCGAVLLVVMGIDLMAWIADFPGSAGPSR